MLYVNTYDAILHDYIVRTQSIYYVNVKVCITQRSIIVVNEFVLYVTLHIEHVFGKVYFMLYIT